MDTTNVADKNYKIVKQLGIAAAVEGKQLSLNLFNSGHKNSITVSWYSNFVGEGTKQRMGKHCAHTNRSLPKSILS